VIEKKDKANVTSVSPMADLYTHNRSSSTWQQNFWGAALITVVVTDVHCDDSLPNEWASLDTDFVIGSRKERGTQRLQRTLSPYPHHKPRGSCFANCHHAHTHACTLTAYEEVLGAVYIEANEWWRLRLGSVVLPHSLEIFVIRGLPFILNGWKLYLLSHLWANVCMYVCMCVCVCV